jgi:hypothetical protein
MSVSNTAKKTAMRIVTGLQSAGLDQDPREAERLTVDKHYFRTEVRVIRF